MNNPKMDPTFFEPYDAAGTLRNDEPQALKLLLPILCIFYYVFPVLWISGLAPFAPFIIVGIGILLILSLGHCAKFTFGEILGVSFFLLGAIIGLCNLGKTDRILTWTHDVVVILSMVLIINAIRNSKNERYISRLHKALLTFIAFVTIVGFVGLLAPGHFQYDTLVMHLLPAKLQSKDYAQSLFQVDLYTKGWFAHTTWRRIKGVSMFATSLAAMLCIWLVYMAGKEKRKIVEWIIIFGAVLILLATLDRTSGVATILGVAIILFYKSTIRGKVFIAASAASILVLVAIAASSEALTYAHKFLVLRGGGSFHGRLKIYSETWRAIMANPWGHGSEHHIAGLGPPLGSHSTWLGLLFKFGVPGLLGFLTYSLTLVFRFVHKNRRRVVDQHRIGAVAGLIMAVILISIFEELYIDSTTAIVLATAVGITFREPRNDQIRLSTTR